MLVARRIKIVKQKQFQLRLVFQLFCKERGKVGMLGLDGEITLLCARRLYGEPQARDYLFRMTEHEVPVRFQDGLALRAVGDNKIGLGLYFYMHGKTCAAGADDAGRLGAGWNIPRG